MVSSAVQTIIQIDADAVRRATASANREFLNNRANAIASGGPDTQARHERLRAPLFGGTTSASDQPSGLGGPQRSAATASDNPSPQRPTPNASETLRAGLERDRVALNREGAREPSAGPDRLGFMGSAEEGTGRFSFSTGLAKLRAAAAAEKAQLDGQVMGLGAMKSKPEATAEKFDVWAEGSLSYFTHDRPDGRTKGQAGLFYAGADYLVLPGLLVGAMVQVDQLEQTSSVGTRSASGTGWMAGPYVSARLTQNLYFDARALWGRSSNQVDPLGAYVDHFNTTRTLIAAKLTGQWTSGALTFRPSAELLHFTDTQPAYINAIGISIDSQTVKLGRLTIGPEVSYRFNLPDKAVFEPFIGAKAVWDFAGSNDTTVDGDPVERDALRGRIEFGATLKSSGGVSLRAQGSYDGIGDSNLKSWQGRATLVVPLQ